MNNIVTSIMFALMAVLGGGTTLYLVVSLPATIIWKFYRKLCYGKKLTD